MGWSIWKIIDGYFTELLEHLDKNSIRNTEISKNEILKQLLMSEKNQKTNNNMLTLTERLTIINYFA